jgi:transposase
MTSTLEDAQRALTTAEGAAGRARHVRNEAVRAALRGGMSTREVARVIGVSQQAVQKIAHAAAS